MSSPLHEVARLLVRDDDADAPAPQCDSGNDYDGRLGLRISSVFVILIGSMFGAFFPVVATRVSWLRMPSWTFFIAKYFGSGVIVATAFIHLLAPANEALTNECLTGKIQEYPFVEGIALITIFILFFVELMAMRFATFSGGDGHAHGHEHDHGAVEAGKYADADNKGIAPSSVESDDHVRDQGHTPGKDHLGHAREHMRPTYETYSAQVTAILILEFGVIFHSIFIGLTLAVAGVEFVTLYIVLVFHQTFEGLGLGSRLAVTPWAPRHHWTPYVLALAYGLTTPVAIAIGLGVKASLGFRTGLLVNGIFDSISAGILIYTGLVELMAHEFMFSENMRNARLPVVLSAFGIMVLGAGLMALLGKWA